MGGLCIMKRVITSSVESKIRVTSDVEIPDWYKTYFAQGIVDKYCKGLPPKYEVDTEYEDDTIRMLDPNPTEMDDDDHIDDIIEFYKETGIEPDDVMDHRRYV